MTEISERQTVERKLNEIGIIIGNNNKINQNKKK